MIRRVSDTKLYKTVTEVLEKSPRTRKQLIADVIGELHLTREQLADMGVNSLQNILRSRLGTIINDMQMHANASNDTFFCLYSGGFICNHTSYSSNIFL